MNATVKDVMSTRVIAVRENASFKEIATRLREHRVSAFPVSAWMCGFTVQAVVTGRAPDEQAAGDQQHRRQGGAHGGEQGTG